VLFGVTCLLFTLNYFSVESVCCNEDRSAKSLMLLRREMQIFEASAVVWKVCVPWDGSVCENPGMTFPIGKTINTELFIDRTATLSIGDVTKKGVDWRTKYILHRSTILI